MSEIQNPNPAQQDNSGGTQQQQTEWYDSFSDEGLKGFVETKGWDAPEKAIHSYRELEKFIGAPKDQLLKLPKDDADVEGWNAVWNRLGRPASAAEYKLPTPEGDSGEFAKVASTWFHEAGIPQSAAEKLAAKWNEYTGQAMAADEQRVKTENDNALAKLRGEIGKEFDSYIEQGGRLVMDLGLNESDIWKIKSAIGSERAIRMFAEIGKGLGEDRGIGIGAGSGMGGMSPSAAKSEVESLRNDKEFQRKLLNGDKEATDKWKALNMSIVGGK